MSSVVPLDPDGHAGVQRLLPWYTRGTLETADRALVELHLSGCERCRAELAIEGRLQRLYSLHADPIADPVDDPDATGWAALRRELESGDGGMAVTVPVSVPISVPMPVPARSPRPRTRLASLALWRVLAAVQFGVIVLLWLAAPRPEGGLYRSLGATASPANALVSFSGEASEAQVRAALRAVGAQLVGGPTATEAYLVLLPRADPATIERLRKQPGVSWAASLEAAQTP